MKLSWGVGAILAILVSVAAGLFGLPYAKTWEQTAALLLLLLGAWTVVAAFALIRTRDQWFYGSWGVILALMSLFAYIRPTYVLGFLLIAIVLLVVIELVAGRKPMAVPQTKPAASSTAQ